jgi:hypothetical protein
MANHWPSKADGHRRGDLFRVASLNHDENGPLFLIDGSGEYTILGVHSVNVTVIEGVHLFTLLATQVEKERVRQPHGLSVCITPHRFHLSIFNCVEHHDRARLDIRNIANFFVGNGTHSVFLYPSIEVTLKKSIADPSLLGLRAGGRI